MSWKRFFQRKSENTGEAAEAVDSASSYVREAERRRLARLLERRAALEYDLVQAEQALLPENRWAQRIRELEAALAEVETELTQLEVSPAQAPEPALPAVAVTVTVDAEAQPATVSLEIDGMTFRWVEEVDWAERGHQIAPARLRRVEGDVAALLAEVGYGRPREELLETLAASLELLAMDALAAARREGVVWVPLTLADLARPCDRCGGWRDVRGRCPTCTARDWQRQQLLLERNRLRQERDEVYRDWQRTRDRLPVVQRQLAEVEADIRALELKGVRLPDES